MAGYSKCIHRMALRGELDGLMAIGLGSSDILSPVISMHIPAGEAARAVGLLRALEQRIIDTHPDFRGYLDRPTE